MKNTDVLVLGGGASGMMAAITAARIGSDVTIVEHNDILGKKILSTGNGKCNFTNKVMDRSFYRGSNPSFTDYALSIFGVDKTLEFFKELGIIPKEKNGYYYPYSEQASSVAQALREEIRALRIHVYFDEVKDITNEEGFVIKLSKQEVKAKKLIIATGLLAGRKAGCDGSAFQYIEKFGHKMVDVVPALVQLKATDSFLKSVAGIRADVALRLYVDEKEVFADKGESLFLADGLSGIVTFQSSRYVSYALKENKKVCVSLDLFKEATENEIYADFKERIKNINAERDIESFLIGLIPDKLIPVITDRARVRGKSAVTLKDAEIKSVIHVIKDFKIKITGTRDFADAQVCAGGVALGEIDEKTMESKLVKNLFFAGEVMDIDGMCGGYNLQWAWSSGYLAGINAGKIDA